MLSNEIDILKDSLKNNVIYLHDFDDVDGLNFYNYTNKYLVFDNVIIKNYFINSTNRNVINCNSSYSKFVEEMNNYNELTIFNNIGYCVDCKILDLISKTKNLLVE